MSCPKCAEAAERVAQLEKVIQKVATQLDANGPIWGAAGVYAMLRESLQTRQAEEVELCPRHAGPNDRVVLLGDCPGCKTTAQASTKTMSIDEWNANVEAAKATQDRYARAAEFLGATEERKAELIKAETDARNGKVSSNEVKQEK